MPPGSLNIKAARALNETSSMLYFFSLEFLRQACAFVIGLTYSFTAPAICLACTLSVASVPLLLLVLLLPLFGGSRTSYFLRSFPCMRLCHGASKKNTKW